MYFQPIFTLREKKVIYEKRKGSKDVIVYKTPVLLTINILDFVLFKIIVKEYNSYPDDKQSEV